MYECRCDERLKTKPREVTDLAYTGLAVELEHLKIETTLTIDKFASFPSPKLLRWRKPVLRWRKPVFVLGRNFFFKKDGLGDDLSGGAG